GLGAAAGHGQSGNLWEVHGRERSQADPISPQGRVLTNAACVEPSRAARAPLRFQKGRPKAGAVSSPGRPRSAPEHETATTIIRRRALLFLVLLVTSVQLKAAVRLPKVIGDGMVLQRNMPDTIWGWADPGEQVTVSFHGQESRANAGPEKRWQVVLDA